MVVSVAYPVCWGKGNTQFVSLFYSSWFIFVCHAPKTQVSHICWEIYISCSHSFFTEFTIAEMILLSFDFEALSVAKWWWIHRNWRWKKDSYFQPTSLQQCWTRSWKPNSNQSPMVYCIYFSYSTFMTNFVLFSYQHSSLIVGRKEVPVDDAHSIILSTYFTQLTWDLQKVCCIFACYISKRPM